ncbi:hypothetical protein PZ895_10735 [Mesorhizobium sp. YIM 152430]|uniref:hypothetical protein n=1 Tax=Mesorhizobium sp. YIM 152430 TaxID=3031761 RepID=UPI0023D9B887|nr:hypothetical protein [Mesorhizobium sp. YIM 152430]MDF1600243.1 hypothetical protein [Mesorhizobium sp. YIM 152430]
MSIGAQIVHAGSHAEGDREEDYAVSSEPTAPLAKTAITSPRRWSGVKTARSTVSEITKAATEAITNAAGASRQGRIDGDCRECPVEAEPPRHQVTQHKSGTNRQHAAWRCDSRPDGNGAWAGFDAGRAEITDRPVGERNGSAKECQIGAPPRFAGY